MNQKPTTINDYLLSHLGNKVWNKAKKIYNARLRYPLIEDGNYEALLTGARVEFPKMNMPTYVLEFTSTTGQRIEKPYYIGQGAPLATLLFDLLKLGIPATLKEDFIVVADRIAKKLVMVDLFVQTKDETQTIRIVPRGKVTIKPEQNVEIAPISIETLQAAQESSRIEVAAAASPSPDSAPIVAPASNSTPSEPSPTPVGKLEVQEVEVGPGTKIRFLMADDKKEGVIIKEFEDEREFAVALPTGEKIIIPADSVVAVVQ